MEHNIKSSIDKLYPLTNPLSRLSFFNVSVRRINDKWLFGSWSVKRANAASRLCVAPHCDT